MPECQYDDLHMSKRQKLFEDAPINIKPLWKSAPTSTSGAFLPPKYEPPAPKPQLDTPNVKNQFSRESIQAIIAAAEEEAGREAAAREAAAAAAAAEEGAPKASGSGSHKRHKSHKTNPEEKEANKEKRLLKLVGAVVVKCMNKHSKAMNHDLFKKHAKEVPCSFPLSPS